MVTVILCDLGAFIRRDVGKWILDHYGLAICFAFDGGKCDMSHYRLQKYAFQPIQIYTTLARN